MNRLKHLREERARIEGEMGSILATCEKESRSPKPEETTKWNALKEQRDGLLPEIKMLEEQEEIDRRSAKPVGKPAGEVEKKEEPQDMSVRGQIARWVEANKTVIDEVRSGQKRDIPELEIRAAATMTVAGVNVGSSIHLPNSGAIQGGVNDLNRNKPTFWSFLRKRSTGLNPYNWVNKTNKQGNATFIGEGVLKPLASFELTVESSVPKKVAERFKVSTELLHDIEGMRSLIQDEAQYEVEMAANTAVLTGTGSSTSPAGITTIAASFTTTSIDVQVANNFDAIRAAATQLQLLNFDRDIVAFVNPVDAAEMDMAKGTDGHYVMPPFATAGGMVVKGVRVIEDNNIAAGFLLIGDMSRYYIYMYQNFHIAWGWENDDFGKNLITMIAEMRFHQFVKANEAGAFIYDSFADIKTAIFGT